MVAGALSVMFVGQVAIYGDGGSQGVSLIAETIAGIGNPCSFLKMRGPSELAQGEDAIDGLGEVEIFQLTGNPGIMLMNFETGEVGINFAENFTVTGYCTKKGVLEVLRYTGEASRRPSRIPAQTSKNRHVLKHQNRSFPSGMPPPPSPAVYSFRRRTWCGCENLYEASVISFLIFTLSKRFSLFTAAGKHPCGFVFNKGFIANSAPPSASAFQTARKVLLSIIRKQIEQFHNQQIAPFFRARLPQWHGFFFCISCSSRRSDAWFCQKVLRRLRFRHSYIF